MIPNSSQGLTWLETHPQVLKGIRRGLERETLRVNEDGSLSRKGHPETLGSALTHKWITTDFVEVLLEFITPVDDDISHMMTIMRDIHRYTSRNLDNNECMWPLSMPCDIEEGQEIELAQYGISNIGLLKTLYREGLKNRYGMLMQLISGVHYNFSLPIAFWQTKYRNVDKEIISAGYLRLIRNYYIFGWVIPYLFGASPAISSSFLNNKTTTLPFRKINSDMYYLPYATSLRLSDFGYTSNLQNNLKITFNELQEYIAELKRAVKTPSKEYEKIGLKRNGKRLQINSNLLQIENELYTPIRPKCSIRNGETLSDALQRSGIEYIEVRSLDINPFSPIGISEQQVRFLDLFMIWCVIVDAPKMSADDLIFVRKNWDHVIFRGRKPNLTLNVGFETVQLPLRKVGKNLFQDLKHIARAIDSVCGGQKYWKVCNELVTYFDNPKLTFSARILRSMIDCGIDGIGRTLAIKYRNIFRNEPLEILNEDDFVTERKTSIIRQQEIEASDSETFEVFLEKMSLN